MKPTNNNNLGLAKRTVAYLNKTEMTSIKGGFTSITRIPVIKLPDPITYKE